MQGAIFGGEKGERMEIYIGTPNERQKEFLRCEKKYIAFGGARGGGKSWAVRCKAKLLALRYPGIRLLLVRRTLPEIEANHLTFLRRERGRRRTAPGRDGSCSPTAAAYSSGTAAATGTRSGIRARSTT